jgi:hypothetical protein
MNNISHERIFTLNDVEKIKQYYFVREMWYQLAFLAGIVFAFFLGLAI